MLPNFNANPNNGSKTPAPPQIMGNPASFCPNPMQFQMGVLNPQLAMPPFANPNAYFAPAQIFPFPQGHAQNFGLSPMFAHNAANSPQLLHNGQFNMPNLVQNVNQLLQMQMAGCGPQNFANIRPPNMLNGNGNLQHLINGNALKPVRDYDNAANDFGAPQHQQNLAIFSPPAAKLQGNTGEFHGTNNNWKRFNKKNLIGNSKGDMSSHRGSLKQQFHHKQYSKGNFKFLDENQGKGLKNGSDTGKQTQVGKGRPLTLNYTEQEIKLWREQRKKNYPSKANMEKKLKDNSMRLEVTDAVAKIRRQELKEILGKQAELGCEVAEIPSCYLSDSERQTDGRVKGHNVFGKRERFPNKFDRRGKFHQNDQVSTRRRPANGSANFNDKNDCFAKKQRLENDNTRLDMDNKREPSLLQKLLSSDIKRETPYLLQIFRFIVMNSFFEDWPSKSLRFPVVIVKESGDESGSSEKKYQVAEDDVSASAGRDFALRSGGQSLEEEGKITV